MMRALIRNVWPLLFSAALCSSAQTNHLVMPAQGTPLVATQLQVINRIPAAKQARWPTQLPVFAHTRKPREFPASSLQALLAESAFRATNVSALRGNARLLTRDGLNHFVVNPAEGRISVRNAEPIGVEAPPDAVPSFEAIRERAVRLASSLGVSTNEMERGEDGSLRVWCSDRETSRRGGSLRFMRSRTVELARSLAGQTFGSLNGEKLTLEMGIDGRLLKFDLNWPFVEAVATNRIFSISQVMDAIRSGKALSDPLTEYPVGEVTEIEVKDVSIDYYTSVPLGFGANSMKADIYPVASLLVVFKSPKGDAQEGGLYAPIMESRR